MRKLIKFVRIINAYLRAKNRALAGSGGNGGRDGGAQTSRGALTVQNARMLHDYQLQLLGRKCS